MEIGLSEHLSADISTLLGEKKEKTLWRKKGERIVGPINNEEMGGQGLKIFEGEDGKERAAEEIRAIAEISNSTQSQIFPGQLRMWTDLPHIKDGEGAILLTLPQGMPLSRALNNEDPETAKKWQEKFAAEIKNEIYTPDISPEDFWADESTETLILLSLTNVKTEFLKSK